jgi:Uma2 family endonuclease
MSLAKTFTLEEFLALPETKPYPEFIQGKVVRKPIPQGKHSRLQSKLCSVIHQVAEEPKVAFAFAFPELRCTFGGDSIIPDVAVFRWDRIPREASGRVANRFLIPPDWAIEIISPDQDQTKVLGKLLHCSEHGTELGWLLEPKDESILIVLPDRRVRVLEGKATLPVLNGVELNLTVEQVFAWLKF